MSSLAKCVDLHNVDEIDGFRLTVAADEYKKRGFTEKEAAEKAVKIAIKELQAERAGIASQLPEVEAKEVAANEKTQTKEPTESYVSDPTGGAVSSEKKTGGTKYPKVVSSRKRRYLSHTTHVKNSGDAAAFADYNLSKFPQERLVALLLGDNGKIIGAHRFSVGTDVSSPAQLNTIAGQALNTKDVKEIVLVHNHPAGQAKLSDEDKAVSRKLSSLLDGTRISASEIISVGDGAYMSNISNTIQPIPKIGKPENRVPMMVREFKTRGENLQKVVSIDDIAASGKELLPEGGLLFLNHQNNIVGSMRIDDYSSLRGSTATEILKQTEAVNANTFAVFEPDAGKKVSPQNLERFANASGIRLLDVVHGGESLQELRAMPYTTDDIYFETTEDYAGAHTAPDRDYGAPLHDLTDFYPDDIYGPQGARYYGHGGDAAAIDRESIAILHAFRGKPNKKVTVYRAIPKVISSQEKIDDLEGQKKAILKRGRIPSWVTTSLNKSEYYDKISNDLDALLKEKDTAPEKIKINPGDWVTINRKYAVSHGKSHLGRYRIIQKSVKASDIITDGNSIHEWGYAPETTKFESQTAKAKDKPLTTEAIEKAFGKMKNVTTGQDRQGNFWFRFNGFPKHTILEMDSINDRIGLTDKRIKTGAFVSGEKQIWFKTGGEGVKADIGSLHHENYHLFKKMGVISKPDARAIHRAIRKKGHMGQITEETEASFIGNAAKSREYARSTRIGRIIQKLRDFLDAMVNLIRATSGGVVRRMESGKIVGEKARAETAGKVSPAMAFETTAKEFGVSVEQLRKEFEKVKAKYKGTDKWLKAPNGKKSNLNEHNWVMTRTPRFKKWFGDSKVLDANGDPLVVYHGTNAIFNKFKEAMDGGIWFTSEKEIAEDFIFIKGEGRDIVKEVFLSIKKPQLADMKGSFLSDSKGDVEYTKEINRELGRGYDGILYKNALDYVDKEVVSNIYAVFEPTQIKSIYNTGAFSQTDPDIRFEMAGEKAIGADKGALAKAQKMIADGEGTSFSVAEVEEKEKIQYETKDVNLSEEIPEEDTAFQQAIDMVAAHWGKQGKYTDERKKLTFMEHHFGTTMYNAKRIGGWYNRFYNVIRNLGQYKFEQQHRLRSEGDASLFAPLETFKKKNKVEYRKLKNYLVDYDIYASGLKVRPTLDKAYEGAYDIVDEKGTVINTLTTEDDAFNVAWELEADKTDFTDAGKEALLNFRKMTRNLYKHYAAGMKEIIEMARLANQPVPKVTTIKAGKKIEIDLKQALQIMGDRQGYYFPRIRETGEWKIEGTKEGMPTQMKFFTSKALSRGYAQKLRREGYKVELVHSGAFSEDLYQTLAPLLAQEQVINSVIDKVSKNEEFDAAYADAFIKQYAVMLKSHGSRARMIGRSDAIGVDVKRGYETDPVRAIAIATEAAAGGYSKQQVAINSMKAITGRDLTWSEYSKDNPDDKYNDYLKVIRKRGADAARQQTEYKEATETLRDILKNQELADRVIGTLKGMAVVWYLGGRVSSAAVNTTNMVMGVPATIVGELSDKSGKISFGSAFRSIGKAGIAYGSFRAGKSKNPGEAALFQEIEKRGWDSPQFNMEALNAIQSKYGAAWGTIVDKSMWMFGVTEKINRATSIAAGYMALCKKNKVELLGTDGAPHEKLLLKARNASDVAHGVYGKENRPYHMRGDHVGARVLQMAYVFQTFTHNYLQEMIRLGLVKKQYGAAAYMALSGGVIGGLGAAVPVGVAKAIASLFDADDPEEEMIKGAEETFGLGKLARYGLPGYLGVSLKGSLATRFEIPDTTLEWFGAPGNVVVDIWSGTKNLTKGFYREGFEQIAPVAIGNISRGLREKTEGVTTKSGSPVFFGKERIKGDSYDMMLRWLSFNPTGISEKREIQWNEYKTMDRYKGRKRDLYERYKRFYSKPPGKRSMKDKVDILSDMRDFNIEIERKKISRIVRPITKRSIKQSMRSLTPSKRERER